MPDLGTLIRILLCTTLFGVVFVLAFSVVAIVAIFTPVAFIAVGAVPTLMASVATLWLWLKTR